MELKITKRDKKLLVVLAIFILVVGVGAGVLFPLLQKNTELKEKILKATTEKLEREIKVNALTEFRDKKKFVEDEFDKERQKFYKIMPSMDIDKMLTNIALSNKATVKDMDIKMPVQGGYTELKLYQDMLASRAEASLSQGNISSGTEPTVYEGIYTAEVQVILQGDRRPLQSVIDEFASLEPKLRVSEILWKKEDKGEENAYTLSMTVHIYMSEDVDSYRLDKAIESAAEKDK